MARKPRASKLGEPTCGKSGLPIQRLTLATTACAEDVGLNGYEVPPDGAQTIEGPPKRARPRRR